MTTKALERKVNILSNELANLRSLVLGFTYKKNKDPEGEYRPEFIRSVLKAMKEPATYTFKSSKNFLKLIQSKK